MVDLYQLLVPLISMMGLLNLLSLKLAIKDNVTMVKLFEKDRQISEGECQNANQSSVKQTLKYMLLNFTMIEMFAVRRAKYKLSLFLSLSIIMVGTYFVETQFGFVIIGTVVYFLYFFVTMKLTMTEKRQKQAESTNKARQKYLQLLYTIISIILNIVMIDKVYKTYQNIRLSQYLANAGINIALDNFVVRPILVVLISLPMTKNQKFQQYMSSCQRQIVMLEIHDVVGERETLLKPGKTISPSKIAKNIPLDFQIQPRVFDADFLMKRQQEGYERPIDILKRIKREKILPPLNLDLQKNHQIECSLNSLFNSTKKEQESQADDHIEHHRFSERGQNQQPELPVKKTICSQNVIMINPSRHDPVENEEDVIPEEPICDRINDGENDSDEDDNILQLSKKENMLYGHLGQPVKISLHSSEHPSSRQQPLRICLNGEINLDLQQNIDPEDREIDHYRRRRQIMTLEDPSTKNTYGFLEVKENRNHSQDIQQIDLNSPERRRRQQLHIELQEVSKVSGVKKKKKRLSHDHRTNREIKFSTGEPYLEYLPNLLSKDTKGKKSQSISRKQMVMDNRVVNSVRRPPPKKRMVEENNENIVPSFKIEQL